MKRIFFKIIIKICMIFCTILCGCSLCDEKNVSFDFKECRSAFCEFEGLSGFNVRVYDLSGEEEFFVDCACDDFSCNLNENNAVSVLVYPVFEKQAGIGDSFFKPAGCIFPYQKTLSFLHGFSSKILRDYYFCLNKSEYDEETISQASAKFNWQKLIQTVEKKCNPENGESFANPWFIDSEKVLKNILQGENFDSNCLNLRKTLDVSYDELVTKINLQLFDVCQKYEIGELENYFILENYIPNNENVFSASFVRREFADDFRTIQFLKKSQTQIYCAKNENYIISAIIEVPSATTQKFDKASIELVPIRL